MSELQVIEGVVSFWDFKHNHTTLCLNRIISCQKQTGRVVLIVEGVNVDFTINCGDESAALETYTIIHNALREYHQIKRQGDNK